MKIRFVAAVLVVLLLSFSAAADEGYTKIRFGILPVLDTLPLHVAVQDRLFAESGLDVELVSFASALERDTAMQAGLLDGYFGDLIATFLLVRQGVPMRIALTSYRTTPGHPMFGVALSPKNAASKLANLNGASIGYSRSTIMEYLLDKMSSKHGLGQNFFNRVEVRKIPIRLQMLMGGQLDASLLPEPLLSLVKFKGGSIVLTAEDLNMPLTVLCLHKRCFVGTNSIYDRFVRAYAKAIEHLREEPEFYRALMAKTSRIPPQLVAKYPIYPYPMPDLPSISEVDDVQDWMVAHGMLKQRLAHDLLFPEGSF